MDDSIYKNWEKYPQGKLRLSSISGAENLWVRILPDGNLGLDNDPVWEKYRYQDIVEKPHKTLSPKILYRRWNAKIWFIYEPNNNELGQRKKLFEILQPYGMPSFLVEGFGYVLVKEKEDALHIITALLAPISYIESVDIGEYE